jgi:hypothetical protein
MVSMTIRLYTLGSVAGLLSCTDPLQPDERLSLSRGGPRSLTPPSALTSTPASSSQVDLSWSDNSSTETGFEIFRSTNGSEGTFNFHLSAGANATTLSDASLAPLTQYCYKVRAVSVVRQKVNFSGFSNVACATTTRIPLLAASNLDVEPYDFGHSIKITWTDNSSNEIGFRVERSTSEAGRWDTLFIQGPNVTLAQNSVAAEQQFCYRVIAFNNQGDTAPSNVDCTSIPTRPTSLTAQLTGSGTIDLRWVDNSAVEDGYEVQRRTNGGLFATLANLPPDAAGYQDSELSPDVTYTYRVRAKKEAGFSTPSDEVNVVTATKPPSAPSDSVVPSSSSTVDVLWTPQWGNSEGFRIERSPDGLANWISIGSTGPYQTGFADVELLPEQRVCYRVFAFNNVGESASNIDCTTPPAGPSDLVAHAVDPQTVDLTWNDNSGVEDGYEIWGWYGGSEDPSEFVADLPSNSRTYRDTRIWPYYAYWVVARKDGGYSDWFGAVVDAGPTGLSLRSPAPWPSSLPTPADRRQGR